MKVLSGMCFKWGNLGPNADLKYKNGLVEPKSRSAFFASLHLKWLNKAIPGA